MDSQGSRLAKSLAAFRAFEGFLLGVNIPGRKQVENQLDFIVIAWAFSW